MIEFSKIIRFAPGELEQIKTYRKEVVGETEEYTSPDRKRVYIYDTKNREWFLKSIN